MKRIYCVLGGIALVLGLGACGHDVSTAPKASTTSALASDHAMAGAAGQMTALYDGQEFTVNMKEMPPDASADLIATNSSINEIYVTNDLDEEQVTIPVLDAIQGDGFNPLWRQVFIVFNAGFTPHQFFSDTEIDAAVDSGEISLQDSDEVYRCSVVGRKKTTEE